MKSMFVFALFSVILVVGKSFFFFVSVFQSVYLSLFLSLSLIMSVGKAILAYRTLI